MQLITVISTQNVERMKQKARKLKREKAITHTQALDEVAKAARFNHWHEVVQANAHFIPAETAFAEGYVLAFDTKDGMDIDTSDGVLIEDHLLEMLTQHQLFEIYSNFIDEEDLQGRPLKEIYPDDELRENFVDESTFMFFRLNDAKDKSLKDVLALTRQYSFWPPFYIWLKGELIDTRNLPVEDDSGNTVGFRF